MGLERNSAPPEGEALMSEEGIMTHEAHEEYVAEIERLRQVIRNERDPTHLGSLAYQLRQALNASAPPTKKVRH